MCSHYTEEHYYVNPARFRFWQAWWVPFLRNVYWICSWMLLLYAGLPDLLARSATTACYCYHSICRTGSAHAGFNRWWALIHQAFQDASIILYRSTVSTMSWARSFNQCWVMNFRSFLELSHCTTVWNISFSLSYHSIWKHVLFRAWCNIVNQKQLQIAPHIHVLTCMMIKKVLLNGDNEFCFYTELQHGMAPC